MRLNHVRGRAHTHTHTYTHTHTHTHTMLYYFNSGGLGAPDIVNQVVTDKTDFIDFENSK